MSATITVETNTAPDKYVRESPGRILAGYQFKKIKARINVNSELTAEDQMKYYSSWYYLAIHILSKLSKKHVGLHPFLQEREVKNVLLLFFTTSEKRQKNGPFLKRKLKRSLFLL